MRTLSYCDDDYIRQDVMKIIIFRLGFILCTGLMLSSCSAGSEDSSENQGDNNFLSGRHFFNLESQNTPRSYFVHLPQTYTGQNSVPLVISLHGGGSTAEKQANFDGFIAKSETEGFIVAYPDAARPNPDLPASFSTNTQIWNHKFDTDPNSFHSKINDVNFIASMIDQIKNNFSIDSNRIYATGFSSGANMSYRLALELSGTIAAIGPVEGNVSEQNSIPEQFVPIITIMGAANPLRNSNPPFRNGSLSWAKIFGISTTPATFSLSGGITRESYGTDGQIVFILIDDMGHTWPGGEGNFFTDIFLGPTTNKLQAEDEIWNFFATQ